MYCWSKEAIWTKPHWQRQSQPRHRLIMKLNLLAQLMGEAAEGCGPACELDLFGNDYDGGGLFDKLASKEEEMALASRAFIQCLNSGMKNDGFELGVLHSLPLFYQKALIFLQTKHWPDSTLLDLIGVFTCNACEIKDR